MTTNAYKIAVIPGDGIGNEVVGHLSEQASEERANSVNVRFGSKADLNASTEKGPLSGVKRTFNKLTHYLPLPP